MPTLTVDFDHSGSPLLEFYASISGEEAEGLRSVGIPAPPVRRLIALVDTGAGRSQIDLDIVRTMGLARTGEVDVCTASTGDFPIPMDLYRVDLVSSGEPPGLFVAGLEVIASPYLHGLRVGMLLGRDALEHCVLTYDGPKGRLALAYGPVR